MLLLRGRASCHHQQDPAGFWLGPWKGSPEDLDIWLEVSADSRLENVRRARKGAEGGRNGGIHKQTHPSLFSREEVQPFQGVTF